MDKWITHLQTMTADDWLKIPITDPERAFSNDRSECESERHLMLKKWHPDVCKDPKAVEVFQHIQALFKTAVDKIETGHWILPNQLFFTDRYDHKFNFKYRRAHDFELGKMYIGDQNILFAVEGKHDSLFRNGLGKMKNFKFASAGMRAEMERFLPRFKRSIIGINHNFVVLEKTPDVVSLKDLLIHCGGKVPAVHVAWIVSSMLNTVCYLRWAGLTHNAISLDTFFVSPSTHDGLLLGGWWYAQPKGSKLISVPTRTFDVMSSSQRRSKIADSSLDQDLVRAVGWELLGNAVGVKLRSDPDIPDALSSWLITPATEKPVEDYSTWLKVVLPAAFGKRRFQKWDVNPTDIYDKAS